MKTKHLFLLPALIAALNFLSEGRMAAQSGIMINSDGAFPAAGLVLSGKTLYGTAQAGGSAGGGTVFALNTDGDGFTNLHSFTRLVRSLPQLTITKFGTQFVLKWPLPVPGTPAFTLQSAWDPSPWGGWDYFAYESYTDGGMNVATVPEVSPQQFYRLIQLSGPGGGCASNRDCAPGSMCVFGTCMTVFGGGGGFGFGFGFGGGGVNGIFLLWRRITPLGLPS